MDLFIEKGIQGVRRRLEGEGQTLPELGPPATSERLAAIERGWGFPLSPSHRALLELHDGNTMLWFDLQLLSSQELIDRARSPGVDDQLAGPGLRVFARSTESDDVLAFDPATVTKGEWAVVHCRAGEVLRRWVTLNSLLGPLLAPIVLDLVDTDLEVWQHEVILWTNLWHSDGSESDLRGVSCGRSGLGTSSRRSFLAGSRSSPLLSASDHERVDRYFACAVEALDAKVQGLGLVIVLTDAPAEDLSDRIYVYYDPCAHLVLVIDVARWKASVSAGFGYWMVLEPDIRAAIARVEARIERGKVVDALEGGIDDACTLMARMSEDEVNRRADEVYRREMAARVSNL